MENTGAEQVPIEITWTDSCRAPDILSGSCIKVGRLKMLDSVLQRLHGPLPYGLACGQVKFDSDGNAKGYILLETDAAFQRMTGISPVQWSEKNGSKSLDDRLGDYDWLSLFTRAVTSGEMTETVQKCERLDKHLKIYALPVDHKSFTIVIQDISEEMRALERVERQVLEREATLRDQEIILNSTHDAISLVVYDGNEFRYVRSNTAHQQLSGMTAIEGKTPVELLGNTVGARLKGFYEECIRSGQPFSYEQTFRFETGEHTWQTSLTPIFPKDGLQYLVCSSRDITDLKHEQREKEMLNNRLKAMFDKHSAVMLMIEPESGAIIDANPSASAFYGYSKEELLGLRIQDINVLPPDEVDRRRNLAAKSKQHYFVFPHRLKNGTIRPVDVFSCPITDGSRTLLSSIIFDVSEREAYRSDLFLEKEKLRTTLKSIGDGVVTTDTRGFVMSLNDVAQDLTGWNENEAEGRTFDEIFQLRSEETGLPVENPIKKVLETGRILGLANHTLLMNKWGQAIPIADSAAPIRAEDGGVHGVVMVFRDVRMEKEQSNHIKYLSYHDSLTDLYNRRYIEEAIPSVDIADNLPMAIILGDVNGLKISNDVFGHTAGDALLQRVAWIIREATGARDLVARWGGDEFLIMMPSTSLEEAEKTARLIKDRCNACSDGGFQISVSLGCAEKETLEEGFHEVLSIAEERMYHQKLLDGKSYRNAIINTLLATLYEKSVETEEHTKRLETFCVILGEKLKLSAKEINELSLLALLHDIGKVGISKEVLQKPSKLTPSEWAEIKRHPEIGYRIAQATPELAVMADFILSHHERWDGKGYPRGLKETEIPMICRILAVTDAYDAMTNDRSYRRAMTKTAAIQELTENSGTQFDPAIVDLFLDILQNEA